MSTKAEREFKEWGIERGWFVVRAAGSLGPVDDVFLYPKTDVDHGGLYHRIVEVKETGDTRADGVGVFYLSDGGGEGREQWETLRPLSWWGFDCVFAVRQKGHLPDDVPRWAIHPVRGEPEPLHQDEGVPLEESAFNRLPKPVP